MNLMDKIEYLDDNNYLTYKELLERIIKKTAGCNEVSVIVLEEFIDLMSQGVITNSREFWKDK